MAWLAVLGAIVWVAAPVTAAIILVQAADRQQLVEQGQELWVTVTPAVSDSQRTLSVDLLWQSSGTLRAPSWSGLIQSVNIAPGGEVKDGDPVAVVDGVERRAFHTAAPLYRPLSVGDTGADVSDVKRILAPYGSQSEGDRFDYAALRASRAYAESVGVKDLRAVSSFDPAWIVYLESDSSLSLSSVDLEVGTVAPPTGSAMASGVIALAAARLTQQAESSLDEDDALESEPAFVQRTDETYVAPSTNEAITYRDLTLVADASGWLDAASVELLREAVTGRPPRLAASATTPPNVGDVVVPAAAVSSADAPTVCARVENRAAELAVIVIAGTNGTSVIRAEGLGSEAQVRLPSPGVTPCR